MRTPSYLFAFVAAGLSMTLPACIQTEAFPSQLKRNAECMLGVLEVFPGVSEQRLSEDSSGGWLHPYLEYRAAEGSTGARRYRFDAQRSNDGHYSFLAKLDGMGVTDTHVTEAVIEKWKTQCTVSSNVIFL